METKEPVIQPLPREKIPYAEEIAACCELLAETTQELCVYLRMGKLWLTWGWYLELLCEEHDSTDQKVLDIIRDIYDTKAQEEVYWQQLTDTILRYLIRRDSVEKEKLLLNCDRSLPEFVMTRLLQEEEIGEFLHECLIWGESTGVMEIAKRFLRIQMLRREQQGEVLEEKYFDIGFAVPLRGKLTEERMEHLIDWIHFLEALTAEKEKERAVCDAAIVSVYGQLCRFRENRRGAKPQEEEWKLWDREEEALLQWIGRMGDTGAEAITVCLQNIFKRARYFCADGVRRMCEKLSIERRLPKECLCRGFTDTAEITHQTAGEYYSVLKYLSDTFCLTGSTVEAGAYPDRQMYYQWLRYLTEDEILFLYERQIFPEKLLGELLYLAKKDEDRRLLSLLMNFM